LIPHFVLKLQADEKIPVYGDGKNVRDWLFVEDHCRGIYTVLTKGAEGETYNIGGGTELTNLELTSKLLEILGKDFESVEFIADRLGHDRRYSVNSSKIEKLGYQASQEFERNLIATINSYINPLAALQ
jgi:dTDP-glucose 4,6-dehydratase